MQRKKVVDYELFGTNSCSLCRSQRRWPAYGHLQPLVATDRRSQYFRFSATCVTPFGASARLLLGPAAPLVGLERHVFYRPRRSLALRVFLGLLTPSVGSLRCAPPRMVGGAVSAAGLLMDIF